MKPDLAPELASRCQKIKLLMVDNDGVLTDGRIVLGDYGDELKFFDVQDGFGLVMCRRAGLQTVLISGKKSRVNKRRAKEVQFSDLYQNAHDKLKVYEKVLKKFKVTPEEVCYIGDDLIDYPPMSRSGLAIAVANAVPEIKEIAHWVTDRTGGHGAVREAIDQLLKAKGLWADVTQRYFR